MVTGFVVGKVVDGDLENTNPNDARALRAQSASLMERLQELQGGDKMIDPHDGKTIGQIVAPPEPGTNVVLAQMRLDRVGLLGDGVWKHTNKIKLGDLGEMRYLPYMPLWWPEIDRDTGKAKKVDGVDDDEEQLD